MLGTDIIGCVGNGPDAATPRVAGRLVARRADASDQPAIAQLARAAHQESAFGVFPFSSDRFGSANNAAMRRPTTNAVIRVERGGVAVGFAFAQLGRHHLSDTGALITVAAFCVVSKAERSLFGDRVVAKLLRTIERWRDAFNARLVEMSITTGITAIMNAYRSGRPNSRAVRAF